MRPSSLRQRVTLPVSLLSKLLPIFLASVRLIMSGLTVRTAVTCCMRNMLPRMLMLTMLMTTRITNVIIVGLSLASVRPRVTTVRSVAIRCLTALTRMAMASATFATPPWTASTTTTTTSAMTVARPSAVATTRTETTSVMFVRRPSVSVLMSTPTTSVTGAVRS